MLLFNFSSPMDYSEYVYETYQNHKEGKLDKKCLMTVCQGLCEEILIAYAQSIFARELVDKTGLTKKEKAVLKQFCLETYVEEKRLLSEFLQKNLPEFSCKVENLLPSSSSDVDDVIGFISACWDQLQNAEADEEFLIALSLGLHCLLDIKETEDSINRNISPFIDDLDPRDAPSVDINVEKTLNIIFDNNCVHQFCKEEEESSLVEDFEGEDLFEGFNLDEIPDDTDEE